MSEFKNILFDFDGTVFDTSPGIYNGIQYMLDFFGYECDRSKFPLMIGPPLIESFEKTIKMPVEKIPDAVKKFREYYSAKGMYECKTYDGITELIDELRKAGKKVLIATSKPEELAKRILEHNGILGLFDFVGGSDIDEKIRYKKPDIIRYVLKENGIEDLSEYDKTLMIGDRKYDVLGAHEVGLKCMGILWGFGDRREFEECKADFISESPEQVKDFILGV